MQLFIRDCRSLAHKARLGSTSQEKPSITTHIGKKKPKQKNPQKKVQKPKSPTKKHGRICICPGTV